MPSIEKNIDKWNEEYGWEVSGDEWSQPWGNPNAQWFGSIYPRIQGFLPASTILEIAPGFGRWTEFLLPNCDKLIGVDVAPKCVEACTRRFADHPEASFFVNDGHSLPMVADSSVDFAFSFDSLVHVELETLGDYLTELSRVLKPDGVAFLHHSNYGTYRRSAHRLAPLQGTFDRLSGRVRDRLLHIGVYRAYHWRADVTAAEFATRSETAGLNCVGQELVNWEGGVLLLDSMSIVTRPGSKWDRPNHVVKNRLFRLEAKSIRLSAEAHDVAS
jgi:ubiquinone/menaquinone biosynthesis C-methylase UbiE